LAFPEEYFIHVQGEQKGPYSFPQLKRMYDAALIPEETLYWRDGMEQLEPVADLCGSRKRSRLRHLKQLRVTAIVVVAAITLVAVYWGPVIKDGLRENNEHDQTAWAAYWRARGFVREKAKRDGESVAFEPYQSATVSLTGTQATVILPSTVYGGNGAAQPRPWKVLMQYDTARAGWRLPDR
jgi:hypothetical protein